MAPFRTYILRCRDGTYYTGHTDDLEARVAAHARGLLPGYTRTRRPVRPAWSEEFATRDDAFRRERQIKGWSRRKKEALIRGDWDALREPGRVRKHLARAAHPSTSSG